MSRTLRCQACTEDKSTSSTWNKSHIGNKSNTHIGRSMEKNHLMRQVEMETIPCVDPPKNHPEVRPLCRTNRPDRSRWRWHNRLVDLVWNGLVKLHTTPKNLLELWGTRQGAQINLAKRAQSGTRHSKWSACWQQGTTNLSRGDNSVLHKTHSSSSAKRPFRLDCNWDIECHIHDEHPGHNMATW